MKLLLDQDVYHLTAELLTASGHDVLKVSDIGLATVSDEEILRKAEELRRVLVTRDRDYGNLVFIRQVGIGVLYLRMLPADREAVHDELNRVLESYSEEELRSAFVVVEARRHRFRKL